MTSHCLSLLSLIKKKVEKNLNKKDLINKRKAENRKKTSLLSSSLMIYNNSR